MKICEESNHKTCIYKGLKWIFKSLDKLIYYEKKKEKLKAT